MSDLSQQQKREAIAKALGWVLKPGKYCTDQSPIWHEPCGFQHPPSWDKFQTEKLEVFSVLPDYFGDLNACHSAELALSDEQHHVFRLTLADLTSPNPTDWNACSRAYISATAEQRAEALFHAISITQPNTKTP